jgi:hypothetical protein
MTLVSRTAAMKNTPRPTIRLGTQKYRTASANEVDASAWVKRVKSSRTVGD